MKKIIQKTIFSQNNRLLSYSLFVLRTLKARNYALLKYANVSQRCTVMIEFIFK
jgi:hypothetical protein